MTKKYKIESKIYEFLGIKSFKKAVFKLEKIIHKKDGKKNINYHIKNSINKQSVDDFKKYLYYNGTIHIKNLLFDIPAVILTIVLKFSPLIIIILFLWLIKDLYCVMLQRYNWIKIKYLEKKLEVREERKIEAEEKEIDKELIRTVIEQSQLNKENLIIELKTFRNYLLKTKTESNEISSETLDIIDNSVKKKIKTKEKNE